MGVEKVEETAGKLSRREFLVGASGFAAGATVGAALGGGLLGLAPKAEAAETAKAPAWPWPYKKLNSKIVAQRAYEGFYKGACCYGAFNAIVSTLADEVGYPFTMMPTDMTRYGEGGVVGWASLCGALNGASEAINLVSSEKVFKNLVNELVGWYTEHPFPSFAPENPKVEITVNSVSGSPLCHVSVTNWCKAAGFGAFSPERSERCARLTADVAAHAVELLNAQVDGKFIATYVPPTTISECMSCHGKKSMNNTRGEMDCVQCHGDPHQK